VHGAYCREIGVGAHERPGAVVVDHIEALESKWMHAADCRIAARAGTTTLATGTVEADEQELSESAVDGLPLARGAEASRRRSSAPDTTGLERLRASD